MVDKKCVLIALGPCLEDGFLVYLAVVTIAYSRRAQISDYGRYDQSRVEFPSKIWFSTVKNDNRIP